MFFCLMSSLLSLSLFKLSTLSDSVLMSSAFPTRSMVGAWRQHGGMKIFLMKWAENFVRSEKSAKFASHYEFRHLPRLFFIS